MKCVTCYYNKTIIYSIINSIIYVTYNKSNDTVCVNSFRLHENEIQWNLTLRYICYVCREQLLYSCFCDCQLDELFEHIVSLAYMLHQRLPC